MFVGDRLKDVGLVLYVGDALVITVTVLAKTEAKYGLRMLLAYFFLFSFFFFFGGGGVGGRNISPELPLKRV